MRAEPKVYLVCYDICDARRLRQIHRTVRGYGERLQYSVYLCELPPIRLAELRADLEEIVAATEDQVLIVPLGSPTARPAREMTTVGRPLALPERLARVF